MSRVVYDSVNPAPLHMKGDSEPSSEDIKLNEEEPLSPDPNQSDSYDNELNSQPYYKPQGTDDITLVFESRFESANLRRAI